MDLTPKEFYKQEQSYFFDHYDENDESKWVWKDEFKNLHDVDDPSTNVYHTSGNESLGYDFSKEGGHNAYIKKARGNLTRDRLMYEKNNDFLITPDQQEILKIKNSDILNAISNQSDNLTSSAGNKYRTAKDMDKGFTRGFLTIGNKRYEAKTLIGASNDRRNFGSVRTNFGGVNRPVALTSRHLVVDKGSLEPYAYTLGTMSDNKLDENYLDRPARVNQIKRIFKDKLGVDLSKYNNVVKRGEYSLDAPMVDEDEAAALVRMNFLAKNKFNANYLTANIYGTKQQNTARQFRDLTVGSNPYLIPNPRYDPVTYNTAPLNRSKFYKINPSGHIPSGWNSERLEYLVKAFQDAQAPGFDDDKAISIIEKSKNSYYTPTIDPSTNDWTLKGKWTDTIWDKSTLAAMESGGDMWAQITSWERDQRDSTNPNHPPEVPKYVKKPRPPIPVIKQPINLSRKFKQGYGGSMII